MGTDSKPDMSNGNTYPAIFVPWGMIFWTPQSGIWEMAGPILTLQIRFGCLSKPINLPPEGMITGSFQLCR